MTKATAREVARQYNRRRAFHDSPIAEVFYSGDGYEVLMIDGETGALLSRVEPPHYAR